jgi:ribosomal protein S4
MRLNQYIAHSGICSRREADIIIKDGRVSVNGKIVDAPGYQVLENDQVTVDKKKIKPEKFVYILLNKPKDYITTTSDEKDRKTVVDIILPKLNEIPGIGKPRIYPVGRLDRNTTGLLLLTNDGELTQQLTHPKYNIEKIYAAEFDSISICLSKGLGAPVGSVLVGSAEFIKKARRVRKVYGGGMRQAGIIAAGGIYALKFNVDRLKIDHQRAKQLESVLNEVSWVKEVVPVETNIVVAILNDASKRDRIIQQLKSEGILIMAFGEGMLRMVTHLDNSDADIDRTCEVLRKLSV